jgi:hypothetical protein
VPGENNDETCLIRDKRLEATSTFAHRKVEAASCRLLITGSYETSFMRRLKIHSFIDIQIDYDFDVDLDLDLIFANLFGSGKHSGFQ